MPFAGTTIFQAPPRNLIERLDEALPPGKIVSVFSAASEVGGTLNYLRGLDQKVSILGEQRVWHSEISIDGIQAFSNAGRLSAVRLVIHDEDLESTNPSVVIGAAVLLHQPDLANMTSPKPAGIDIPADLGARLIMAVDDDYRHFGIGRYMFEKVVPFLRLEDGQTISIEVPFGPRGDSTRKIFENLDFSFSHGKSPLRSGNLVMHRFFKEEELREFSQAA
jgi:GNAT superfamily N-acetyltransferase